MIKVQIIKNTLNDLPTYEDYKKKAESAKIRLLIFECIFCARVL